MLRRCAHAGELARVRRRSVGVRDGDRRAPVRRPLRHRRGAARPGARRARVALRRAGLVQHRVDPRARRRSRCWCCSTACGSNSAERGTVDLSTLPLRQIERIEVLRGGRRAALRQRCRGRRHLDHDAPARGSRRARGRRVAHRGQPRDLRRRRLDLRPRASARARCVELLAAAQHNDFDFDARGAGAAAGPGVRAAAPCRRASRPSTRA